MAKLNITRESFRENANPLVVKVGDTPILADAKEFSTGSFGWFAGGKGVIEVNGVPVQVQIGVNVTVIGSKEA